MGSGPGALYTGLVVRPRGPILLGQFSAAMAPRRPLLRRRVVRGPTINPITHTRLVTPGETARLSLCANSFSRFLRTEPSHNLLMLPVKHSRRGGVLTQRALGGSNV